MEFPIIILYNKYRGVFKLMYYHLDTQKSYGGTVFASLAISGTSVEQSALFNGSSSIVDPNEVKLGSVVSMSTDLSDINQKFGLIKAWYAFEWDVSYFDSSISNKFIKFQIWGSDVKNISLSAVTNGSISGKIQVGLTAGSDNGILSSDKITKALTKGGTKAVMKLKGNDLVKHFADKKQNAKTDFMEQFYGLFDQNLITSAASSLIKPITSFITKPISKLIGKVFPGKSPEPINHIVDLNVSFKSEITGTVSQDVPIAPIKMDLTEEKQLGIYNLSRRPKLKVFEGFTTVQSTEPVLDELERYKYYQGVKLLDKANDLITINPYLEKIATVEKYFTAVCIDFGNHIRTESYKDCIDSKFGVFMHQDKEKEDLIQKIDNITGDTIFYPFSKDNIVYDITGENSDNSFFGGRGSVIFKLSPSQYNTYNYPKPDNSLVVLPPQDLYVRLNLIIRPKNGDAPVSIVHFIKPDYIEDQATWPYPLGPKGPNDRRGER